MGFLLSLFSLILFSTVLAQVAIIPSPIDRALPCSVRTTTSAYPLTISNPNKEIGIDIYFKSFEEQGCDNNVLFLLPPGTSRVIQAFQGNSFLSVDAKTGSVVESFQTRSRDENTWVIPLKDPPPPPKTAEAPKPSPTTRENKTPELRIGTIRHSSTGNSASLALAVVLGVAKLLIVYFAIKRYGEFLREKRVIQKRSISMRAPSSRIRGIPIHQYRHHQNGYR